MPITMKSSGKTLILLGYIKNDSSKKLVKIDGQLNGVKIRPVAENCLIPKLEEGD